MAYLMALSVGPVQEFIATARRTRDLWFGSTLLSEISKSVASSLQGTQGVTLIFPSPQNAGDLHPDYLFNVSNILLARLDDSIDPVALWPSLKAATEARWRALAGDAIRNLDPDWIVRSRWDKQLADVVEFYAAWLPLQEAEHYRKTRSALMRLLAGRKACRDFEPWHGEAGVPKSSLDGACETVLTELPPDQAARRASKMKLSKGEQLDAVGVVKRLGGTRRQYPSVVRIAGDPWLRGLKPDDRQKLIDECSRLMRHGLVQLSPDRFPQYSSFPFEGACIYLIRVDEAVEEAPEDQRAAMARELKGCLKGLYRSYGEPEPYLALLAADGDRMGEALSKIDDLKGHQDFSRVLSAFTASAASVIASHSGALIYSGGDDVLAFVPVDKAVACARALQREFTNRVQGPTLSVGIAIGHMMEPLEILLSHARSAEKLAKTPDRNGLAVVVHPRSGNPISFRAQWDAAPDETLATFARYHLEDLIPDKAAFELHRLSIFYGGVKEPDEEYRARITSAIRAEAAHILGNKKADDNTLADIKLRIEKEVRNPGDLERIASALIIARRLKAGAAQAGGIA